MYNFNHLYYFYITAKSGSVTAAAKHLSVSQPSLTSQIKVLEQQLDVKLFQKVGRRNELTENGSIVYGYCRRMFEIAEDMSAVALQGLPSASRRIYIGVSDDVERSLVVEVVSKFLKKQTLTTRPLVSIISGTQKQLTEKLKFREVDIIVTETPVADPKLMNLARAESPVVLVCSMKSKEGKELLKGKPRVQSISSILRNSVSQWLMPSTRFKLRSEIDHFFEDNEIKGRTVLESDVLSSLVRSVVDDIGLAFLPVLYLKNELKEKSIRILGSKKGYWTYKLWLVCDPCSTNDDLINSFTKSFISVVGVSK